MPGEKQPEPEYKNESEGISETIKLIEQPTDSLKLASTLLQPGQTIGNCFEVIEELGSGGMSIVYRVRHLLLNKDFALKLLRPDRSLNEDAFKRFKQEAKAASGLIHPNICRVTDFGIDANLERPYLVMDLAEGETLAQFIKERGKLSSEEALTISIQVAEALSVAHKAGIVHRDLKPGNIMIQKQDKSIKAMVVDFGIAKILEGENQEPDLTQTGEVFGTPNYMSPEQCRGQKLDARSDIYSFGCVLYEMLSGQVPFVATNSLEILMMHVGKEPKSIKGTGVSAETEAVVLKCMEKDPQNRYL